MNLAMSTHFLWTAYHIQSIMKLIDCLLLMILTNRDFGSRSRSGATSRRSGQIQFSSLTETRPFLSLRTLLHFVESGMHSSLFADFVFGPPACCCLLILLGLFIVAIFGSFSISFLANFHKFGRRINKKVMKNVMKNGYCETPGRQTQRKCKMPFT